MEMLHPAMTAQLQDALHVSLAVLILTLLQWPVFQSVLAYVQLTPMLPLEPLIILEDALHALINVSLMLLAKLLLLLASALSAHGPHLEAMTMVHALIALLILQPRLLERLPLLIATAWQTSMALAKRVTVHALLVPMMAPSSLKHQQLPLPPLIAHAQPTPTETAAHAQFVLMAAIRTVPQMFKQLPDASVLRATTPQMVRMEQPVVQSVQSIRTKWLPETEL